MALDGLALNRPQSAFKNSATSSSINSLSSALFGSRLLVTLNDKVHRVVNHVEVTHRVAVGLPYRKQACIPSLLRMLMARWLCDGVITCGQLTRLL